MHSTTAANDEDEKDEDEEEDVDDDVDVAVDDVEDEVLLRCLSSESIWKRRNEEGMKKE